MTRDLLSTTLPMPATSSSFTNATLEQKTTLVLVIFFFTFLGLLVIRCFRILLDPYQSMSSLTWTNYMEKEALDYKMA